MSCYGGKSDVESLSGYEIEIVKLNSCKSLRVRDWTLYEGIKF